MSEFYISCELFENGGEIPKQCGYNHQNDDPSIQWNNQPENGK